MAIILTPEAVAATDDVLLRISLDNPGYRVEREEDGTITMSPTHTKGGAKSGEAFVQLYLYAKRVGGKAFDSSTGFAIGPQKRVYSPDAAWIAQARIEALTLAGRDAGYWPITPDIIIEVKSDSDDFATTRVKAATFVERGSRYALAVDPITRDVVELGICPSDLTLDFNAIIDA